ncbi:MAG: BamA/TamA family outer membrane protein [Flavobacteriales bacterium]|nr:BamA/TamA family outer membrane protein [Flavobacteriales bacterium]
MCFSFLTACGPSRRLQEGEYFLKKQKILNSPSDLDSEEVHANLKQKTNRKLFGLIRFNLQMYNLPNPDKIPKRTIKKIERLERKNQKRLSKGKDTKEMKPAAYWLQNVVGEAPVLLDSTAIVNSRKALQKYFMAKGFFDNVVRDSVVFKKPDSKKRAKVYYKVEPGLPYRVNKREFPMHPNLEKLVKEIPNYPMIKEGDRFDVDIMDEERELISDKLRDNGYYFFNKDFIYFKADSAIGNRKVDLLAGIQGSDLRDSIPNDLIRTWRINTITVEQFGGRTHKDTTGSKGHFFLDAHTMAVKPEAIIPHILFKRGSYFKESVIERTYRRLLALPVFSNVNISFERSAIDGYLDCNIKLRKSKKQSFSIETKGTNSSGFLGIEGDLVYRNKNIFKGAELLTVKLRGGIQSQAPLTEDGNENPNNISLNTIEFGPEVSVQFPKFLLPISQNKFARSSNPKTNITGSFNFQSRPDYKRSISNLNFGYSWSETSTKKHFINPFEVSVIKIDPSEEFSQRLDELNNRLLVDAYKDHFITSTLYGFNFNSQRKRSQRRAFFYQGTAESSGSLLRGLHKLFNADQDSTGSYSMFNIRFAQFVKTDHDFRYYRYFSDKSSLAFRFAAGIGVPLQNLDVLPFSESFFAGGSSGIRAWQARSLGPGSYFEPNTTLDKIGDIHLEANLEYRFDVIDYLEGALFYDAGNIWLIDEDPLRPGSSLKANEFLDEVAMGAGIGIRLDFDFFIIRLDVGTQLKDPALEKGERWFYQPKALYNTAIDDYNSTLSEPDNFLSYYQQRYTFNLGINYPF